MNSAAPGSRERSTTISGRVSARHCSVTVIDGALQGVAERQESSGSTVILNPQGGQQVIDEILRATINIPPTITVNQGARIQVIVARDVDFRPVYELAHRRELSSAWSEPNAPEDNASSLTHTLAPLRPILDDPQRDRSVHQPTAQEGFIQTYDGWSTEPLPFADFYWCRDFAKLVGSATKQRIDEVTPILSATLPTAERVQFVLPPATLAQARLHHDPPSEHPGANPR